MDDALVTVRNVSYLHEAEFIKSLLEAEGIDALIPDEQMAGLSPALEALGGIRVQIRASDVDRANEILSAVIAE
jgi:hypothetical protein